MTVEAKSEGTQMAEPVESRREEPVDAVEKPADAAAEESNKSDEPVSADGEKDDSAPAIEKSASYKEESNFLSDLKEAERKALIELRAKIEEAILEGKLFKEEGQKEEEQKPREKETEAKEEEKPQQAQEGAEGEAEEEEEEKKPENQEAGEGEWAKPNSEIDPKVEEESTPAEEKDVVSLWGVPLLPSKGLDRTDVILLKFLRARDFKVKEAFEMLKNTLRWRREAKIDSVLDEEDSSDLRGLCYMDGLDREGHPVCYNLPGIFQNEELYQRTFATEQGRARFLRWRAQVMEKGIEKLDLRPGGVNSMLQITDLKNAPGPSKKELRTAMKQIVDMLQDNYPEFVARNIFINVPFWYYALNAILSPFLTQRTKSKFVFARPAKVTETLLKYIPAEAIPVKYGGLKRDSDTEFSVEDGVATELTIKAGSTESIEIPVPEAGTTLLWDLTVLGWDVSYKEEFIPTDEGSYTVIVQKSKKMGSQEETVRNSFRCNESGKLVLTINNNTFKKKKVLYRHISKSS